MRNKGVTNKNIKEFFMGKFLWSNLLKKCRKQ